MLTNQDLKKIGELLEPKFDAIDKKFDAIDGKFDAIDGKFDAIDGRFEQLESRLGKKIDRVDKKLTVFVDEMDRRTIDQEKRLDRIDKHLGFPELPRTKPSKKMMRLLGQLAN